MDNPTLTPTIKPFKEISFEEVRTKYSHNKRRKDIPNEQRVITKHICDRIRKGLGVNIVTTGSPGSGKSYFDLRIAELVKKELHNEELTDPKKHIADNIADAFRFIRNVKKPGEPLILEEVSNMANSRRSMSKDNLSLNLLLDTVRKKQIVLMMNAPTIQSLDKHIQRMSHLYIETLRVNRKKGITTVKVLRLQHSQSTGKIYTHRLHINGKAIWRCVSYIPSKAVRVAYEEKKDDFLNSAYEMAELQAADRKAKIKKQLEKHNIKKVMNPLTETQKMYLDMAQQGMSVTEIAKKLGKAMSTVSEALITARKKLKIVTG